MIHKLRNRTIIFGYSRFVWQLEIVGHMSAEIFAISYLLRRLCWPLEAQFLYSSFCLVYYHVSWLFYLFYSNTSSLQHFLHLLQFVEKNVY